MKARNHTSKWKRPLKKGLLEMDNKSKGDKIAEMRKTGSHYMAVINAPNEKSTQEEKKDFLSALLLRFKDNTNYPYNASIIHDKDIEPSGKQKTIHAHIFIDTPLQPTKRALLSDLSKWLNISEDLISLEPTNNSFLLLQYLIHKNDKLKAQYDSSEIITNDIQETEKRLNKFYRKPLDEDELQETIFISKTFSDLIKKIGLENGKKYQSVFKQVKQEQEQDFKGLENHILRMKYNMESLQRLLETHFRALNEALTDKEKEYLQIDTLKQEIEDIFAKFI